MALILIVILAIAAYGYFRVKTQHLPEAERKALSKKWLWGGGIVLLALVAFTKGQFIVGAIASLVALVMRVLPLVQSPIFEKIFGNIFSQDSANDNQKTAVQTDMTKERAAGVLGVSLEASEEEIVAAHKRLMQKVHPDKGGSETLAAEINQAKKVLLG